MKNIAVIGLWHLGCINAAGFASRGYKVVGIDTDKKVIANLKRGKAPIFEPGLNEQIKKCIAKNKLSFTSDYRTGLKKADYVFVAFDTKLNDKDEIDLSNIFQAISDSAIYLKDGCLVIIHSQIPIGTSHKFEALIVKNNPLLDFGLVYIPENLKLGESLKRFSEPDMLIIGSDEIKNQHIVSGLYYWVPKEKIKKVGVKTAEMVKHCINSHLASQISFANEMGNLCDAIGDVAWQDVADILHMEPRIGKGALLKAELPISGGTILRDVQILRKNADVNHVETFFLDGLIRANQYRKQVIINKIRLASGGSLKNQKIAILGLVYKPGTSTLRRSMPLEIAKALVAKGAHIRAYDPQAEALPAGRGVERVKNIKQAITIADVVVILTAWPEFKTIKHPKIIDFVGITS